MTIRRAWAAALLGALALVPAGCLDTGGDDAVGSLQEEDAVPAATSGLGSYIAARHARRQHDTAAANIYFGRALADDPDNPDLLEGALVSALAERDMAAAAAFARRLDALTPDSVITRVTIIADSVLFDNFADALAAVEELPNFPLSRYLGPLLRAWALGAQGDAEKARAALRPESGISMLGSVREYHAALLADLLDRPEEAEAAFESALAAGGVSLRVALAAGSFYQRHGREDDARAVYDRFLRNNPDEMALDARYRTLDSGVVPPSLVANPREGFAEAFYGAAASLRGTVTEAARIYAQLCLALRPDHDACLMVLGEIYAEIGNLEKARETFGQVDADSPLKWSADLRKADILSELGRLAEAVEQLRNLARAFPGRPGALIALADMLMREKRYAAAAAAYDQAFARIPMQEQRHWRLLYSRGVALERSDQWERAEEDFLRALEFQPDQPQVLNYLGYSWVEQGRNYDRARAMIEKAVEQSPEDGYIVDSLGWVLFRLGEFEEAVRHLERANELLPGDAVTLDHFGDGLWRAGRRNEARFQWQRALISEPDPELEDSVRGKLQNGLPALDDTP